MRALLSNLLLAESSEDIVALVTFGALIALALVGVPLVWKSIQTSRLTGPIAIQFDPGSPRLGETCRARVTIRPTGPVVVEAIDVRICAVERIRWKVRTNNQSQTRSEVALLFDLQLPTRRPGQVLPPQTVAEIFEFTIPSAGPPSFQAPMNRIAWTVTVSVRMAGLNRTDRVYPITVPPLRVVS